MTRSFLSALFALALAAVPRPAGAQSSDPLWPLAGEIAETAERTGNLTLAVLGFVAEESEETQIAELLEERLLSHLVVRSKIPVVERRMISRLLRERYLSEVGAVAPQKDPAAILPVDAVVAGSVSGYGGELELVTRLIEVKTGRILFAAVSRIPLPGRKRGKDRYWYCFEDGCPIARADSMDRLQWMVEQAHRGVWRFETPKPRGR